MVHDPIVRFALPTTGYFDWHPGVGWMPAHPCTDGRSSQNADETTSDEDARAVKTVAIAFLTGIVRERSEGFPAHQPGERSQQCTFPLVVVRAPRDLELEDASSGDDRGRSGRVSVRTERERVRCR